MASASAAAPAATADAALASNANGGWSGGRSGPAGVGSSAACCTRPTAGLCMPTAAACCGCGGVGGGGSGGVPLRLPGEEPAGTCLAPPVPAPKRPVLGGVFSRLAGGAPLALLPTRAQLEACRGGWRTTAMLIGVCFFCAGRLLGLQPGGAGTGWWVTRRFWGLYGGCL
eukprot:366355-Chlamydomonas_euryale.AAC.1